MIKKINILLLCCVSILFFINFISALSVTTLTPSIEVQYNTEKQIQVNITNDKAYKLFDIALENEYATMETLDLNQSKSQIVTITLKVNKTGNFDTTLNFKGYKKKSCTEVGSITHQVDVNAQNLFSEDDLTICTGDVVSITNKNNGTESLYYKLESVFDTEPKIVCDLMTGGCPILSLGSTYTTSFNNKGYFSFQTFETSGPWYSSLQIEVSNQTILTHNNEDDGSLVLNIKSVLEPTTLTIDYITNYNFSMSYTEVKSGSLVIKNIGANKAVGITLNSDWVVFNKNNFDLEPQATSSIDFDIYPSVLTSSDTGKSYKKVINISSQNSDTINKTIFIYVEYSEIIAGAGDLAYVKYLDNIFCPAHPHSFLCEQEPRVVVKEVPKYNCPKFLAELTAEDVLELIQKTLTSTKDAERVYNLIKQYSTEQNMSLGEIFYKMNQSEQNTDDTKKEMKSTRSLFFVLGFSIIFISLILGIGYYLYKYYKRRYRGEY